jgi:hypothetical protein
MEENNMLQFKGLTLKLHKEYEETDHANIIKLIQTIAPKVRHGFSIKQIKSAFAEIILNLDEIELD